jgi:quercetin dioxygenase-like cupin family protein
VLHRNPSIILAFRHPWSSVGALLDRQSPSTYAVAVLQSVPVLATVPEKVLHHRGNYRVRRLSLAPGEATPWHRDPFHRVTVILSGDALHIEHQDGDKAEHVAITPGEAHWQEPTDRVHRAVNVGGQVYEEITIFFLDHPDAVPQPIAES